MTSSGSGADLLCATLAGLGVDTVFGLPGTQTVRLYEALRASPLRTIVSTHELAATFMAIGYFRSSGRVAAVSTIPGPGFTYALTGLAEARFDSAALLLFVVKPRTSRGAKFRFQDIDQEALARPLAKAFMAIRSVGELVDTVRLAYRTAIDGEPGPVVVEIQAEVLDGAAPAGVAAGAPQGMPDLGVPAPSDVDAVWNAVRTAGRRVLLVGQGAAGAAGAVAQLAERLDAIVVATSSGRGVVPEDRARVLPIEYSIHDVRVFNDLAATADLVLALGCKLGHNGAAGFRLALPEASLVHIDASHEVVGANYPARLGIVADVPAFVGALLERASAEPVSSAWADDERRRWADRAAAARTWSGAPTVVGAPGGMAEVLGALRGLVPRDACLVTDSGLHQMTTRTWWTVLAPRALVTPADYQSMGFGLPAAIGAAIAAPSRTVVLVTGDGALAMTAMELATAVREGVRLMVVVCNDRGFGLIRRQQVLSDTQAFAVDFASPDYPALADALGAEGFVWAGAETLTEALACTGVSLVELVLGEHPDMQRRVRKQRLKAAVRQTVGDRTIETLRRWLRL